MRMACRDTHRTRVYANFLKCSQVRHAGQPSGNAGPYACRILAFRAAK
jgi:hypothetical protein